MNEVKLTFRALNQTAAAMGDPLLSLYQMNELVETIFDSADEDLLQGNGEGAKLKYAEAIAEFVDHPVMESYLVQGGSS